MKIHQQIFPLTADLFMNSKVQFAVAVIQTKQEDETFLTRDGHAVAD